VSRYLDAKLPNYFVLIVVLHSPHRARWSIVLIIGPLTGPLTGPKASLTKFNQFYHITHLNPINSR